MSNAFSQTRARTSINVIPSVRDDSLVTGNIYAISIQSAPTRQSLIRHALTINLAHGIACTLITRLLPEECLLRFENAEASLLLKSIESGTLSVYSMIGDYQSNIFRFGPERFLRELEYFRVPQDSLIVMDQADALFTVDDCTVAAEQARAYREWMRKMRNVALFLFLHTAASGRTSASYQALTDYFGGVAGLYVGRNNLRMAVDFWSMSERDIMAKQYAIDTGVDGELYITPSLLMSCGMRRDAGGLTAVYH